MSDKPTHYELTPRALADLDDIWRYTAEKWSIDQADQYIDALARVFEALVAMPSMARERKEFSPPVRIHRHDQHLLVYVIAGTVVIFVRVLGGRQDWHAILNAVDR